MKWSLNYIKIFILFSLSFNTALAGEIFTTDFESGSIEPGQVLDNGFYWHVGKNTTVSSEKSNTGSYSLKLTYPGVDEGMDSFAEQAFSLGGHYPEIWVKYDIFVPLNYTHRNGPDSDNNKGFLHLWAGTYAGTNREGPLLGPNFWPTSGGSNITMWGGARVNGTITLDKHWTMDPNGTSDSAITSNDLGKWMTIVIHVKYATVSNNNGVYEIWKTNWTGNTIKLMNIHDGAWYATKPNSTEPARGFAEGYLLGWANSGFNNDTSFYIDNITFSTTPLVADYISAPKPPILFSSIK